MRRWGVKWNPPPPLCNDFPSARVHFAAADPAIAAENKPFPGDTKKQEARVFLSKLAREAGFKAPTNQ